MKRFVCIGMCLVCLISFVSAHPGRLAADGGHRDNNNVEGLGYYHYHCGDSYSSHPAHLHSDGICPYNNTVKTTTSAQATTALKTTASTVNQKTAASSTKTTAAITSKATTKRHVSTAKTDPKQSTKSSDLSGTAGPATSVLTLALIVGTIYLLAKKKVGCFGAVIIFFVGIIALSIIVAVVPLLLPILLVVGIVYLIYRVIRSCFPQLDVSSKTTSRIGNYMTKNAEFKNDTPQTLPPAKATEYSHLARAEQIIADCNHILDTTKNISTFVSRYKTLHDTLSSLTATPAKTEMARSEWQQALFYYPDRLRNVIDRAAADAYTLKTPRGQFSRFDRMLTDLDTAYPFNTEIRDAIAVEQMRLREMRDECVLHGNAPDEPVSQDTTQDDHVDF